MSTPLCILLVDDSPFFLNLQRMFLHNTPATILEAHSAAEALELARQYRPSLVFMDIDMPEVDGLACCRQMRKESELQNVPIVLIGDRSTSEDVAAARAAGCSDYLTKPLNRRQYLETGHRWLISIDRRELRRDCQIPVSFAWEGEERHGLCIDISSGGMFLKIEPHAAKGDLLSLNLRLPDLRRTSVTLTGRVAWVNLREAPIKAGYPPGYGVEFVGISVETGVALRRCFGV